MSKTYPSGRNYDFTNGGFGRPTHVYYGSSAYLSGATYHPNGKLAFDGCFFQYAFDGLSRCNCVFHTSQAGISPQDGPLRA